MSGWLSAEDAARAEAAGAGWVVSKGREALEALEKRFEERSNATLKAQEEAAALREELEAARAANDGSGEREAMLNARKQLTDKDNELSEFSGRLRAAEQLANYRQGLIAGLREDLDDLQKRYAVLTKEHRRLDEEKRRLESDGAGEETALLRRRLEMKEKDLDWFKATLEERSKELQETRRGVSEEVVKRDSEIAQLKTELLEKAQAHQKRSSTLQQELDEIRALLQSSRQQAASLELEKKKLEEHQEEQEKHISRMKEFREEGESLLEEKDSKIEELLKRLTKLQEDKETALKQQADDFRAELDKLQKEHEEEIKNGQSSSSSPMVRPLLLDNDKIRQVLEKAEVSQSAAVMELADQGITLTSVFDQLLEAKSRMASLEEENVQLKSDLRSVLKQVEEAAPKVQSLKDSYDRALEWYDQQGVELSEAKEKCHHLEKKLEQERKKLEVQERTREKLLQERNDLQAQVLRLLKTAKNGSGGAGMIASSPEKAISAPNKSKIVASDVITRDLVEYSSVEELQANHAKLLIVVRDLAERQETLEQDREKEREKRRKEEYVQLEAQVEEMKNSRRRQEMMLATLVNDRNVLRTMVMQLEREKKSLVEELGRGDGEKGFSFASPSSSTRQGKKTLALEDSEGDSPAVKFLKDELEKRSNEHKEFREAMQNDYKALEKRCDELKEELVHRRGEALEASGQRDVLKHSMKSLEDALNEAREEMKRLRKLSDEKSEELMKAHSLLGERDEVAENLRQQIELLKTEKSQWEKEKAANDVELKTISKENSSLRENLKELRDLLSAHKDLKESRDAELLGQLQDLKKRNSRLEEEVDELKMRLSGGRQLDVQTRSDFRKLQDERDELLKDVAALKERVLKAETEGESAKEKAFILEERVKELRESNTRLRQGALGSESVNSSTSSEGNYGNTLGTLRSQLEAKTKDLEVLRSISKKTEENLQKISSASEKMKEEKDAEIEHLKKERGELKVRVQELETSAQSETNAGTSVAEAEARIKVLEAKLEQTEKEVSNASAQAKEAKENYAQELQRHANAAAELEKALKSRGEAVTTHQQLAAKLENAEKELEMGKESWKAERDSMTKTIESLKEQSADAQRHNELLRQEVNAITQELKGKSSAGGSDLEEGTASEVSRLRELLTISQRQRDRNAFDKEEAEFRLTKADHQLERVKAELDSAKKQLIEQSERVRKDSRVISLEELDRLELALQENKMIRKLNVTLKRELDDTRDKLAQTEERWKDLETEKSSEESRNSQNRTARSKLEAEVSALTKERDLFKQRHDELLQRFGNKVDPAEHDRVVAQLAEREKKLKDVQQSMAELKEVKESSEAELLKRQETIARLRKLGQKYRDQAKSLEKEKQNQKKDFETQMGSLKKIAEAKTEEVGKSAPASAPASAPPSDAEDPSRKRAAPSALDPEANVFEPGTSKEDAPPVKKAKVEASSMAEDAKQRQKEMIEKKIADLKRRKAASNSAVSSSSSITGSTKGTPEGLSEQEKVELRKRRFAANQEKKSPDGDQPEKVSKLQRTDETPAFGKGVLDSEFGSSSSFGQSILAGSSGFGAKPPISSDSSFAKASFNFPSPTSSSSVFGQGASASTIGFGQTSASASGFGGFGKSSTTFGFGSANKQGEQKAKSLEEKEQESSKDEEKEKAEAPVDEKKASVNEEGSQEIEKAERNTDEDAKDDEVGGENVDNREEVGVDNGDGDNGEQQEQEGEENDEDNNENEEDEFMQRQIRQQFAQHEEEDDDDENEQYQDGDDDEDGAGDDGEDNYNDDDEDVNEQDDDEQSDEDGGDGDDDDNDNGADDGDGDSGVIVIE